MATPYKYEELIFSEKYRSPYIDIPKPTLNHIPDNYEVVEAKLMGAGLVRRKTGELEFQVLKVYLKKKDTNNHGKDQ